MYVESYTDFSASHNCLTSCTITFTTTFTNFTFLNTHRFLIPDIMKHIMTINTVTLFFFQDLKIPSFLDLRILIPLDFLLPLGCYLVSCRISFKKKCPHVFISHGLCVWLLDPHNLLVNLVSMTIHMLFISYFIPPFCLKILYSTDNQTFLLRYPTNTD